MPIVTLTTDIGQNDYIVGAIKGQLLTADPTCNIVDITHCLSPFNYLQAAYICSNAYKYYPAGTVHILLINLFDTHPHHMLMAEHNGQFIVCPDNGVLTLITGARPAEVVAVPIDQQSSMGVIQCTASLTAALAQLWKGASLAQIGDTRVKIEEKYPLRATVGPDWMEGQIIFIDNFENVVVNVTQQEFEEQRKGRRFKIVFTRNEMIETLSRNYASVAAGEKLAWFNSAGYLEIAINKGNVAGLFGLQGYSETSRHATLHNKWFYQTVRIFFE